eukprot:4143582-Amphidinium_carterae.1
MGQAIQSGLGSSAKKRGRLLMAAVTLSAKERLRAKLQEDGILIVPGVWDVLFLVTFCFESFDVLLIKSPKST